jgi:hypothetical protein
MIKHGTISDLLKVTIIGLTDPNKLLPIYEEIDIQTADLIFTLKVCSGGEVLAETSSSI